MDRQPTPGQILEVLLDFREAMGGMERRLDGRIDSLESRLGSRIDSVECRFDIVENRLGMLEERLVKTEDRMIVRFDGLEREMRDGFAAVNQRLR